VTFLSSYQSATFSHQTSHHHFAWILESDIQNQNKHFPYDGTVQYSTVPSTHNLRSSQPTNHQSLLVSLGVTLFSLWIYEACYFLLLRKTQRIECDLQNGMYRNALVRSRGIHSWGRMARIAGIKHTRLIWELLLTSGAGCDRTSFLVGTDRGRARCKAAVSCRDNELISGWVHAECGKARQGGGTEVCWRVWNDADFENM
jgi:hypothetical protein